MADVKILVVEDDSGLREALVDTLLIGGYQVIEAESGEEALVLLGKHAIDLIVSDVQMGGIGGLDLLRSVRAKLPSIPFLLMTAFANVNDAVRAMQDGATDYLAKPFAPEVLMNLVSRYAPNQGIEKHKAVVADPRSVELLNLAARVAQSDANVMITGPSGSGKEVLARHIHDHSARSEGPFVAINCAAIPENMLEATLFGYEKGAFTGALQACPGKFEQAQGGTILLDEITEMDLGLQAKLLRVLQEREVERLGSRKSIALDVRVLATSNRDLKQAVAEHAFREDLYYRLNVFPLQWLPLSERPGDIKVLANHLIARHCQKDGRAALSLTDGALQRLIQHRWPGNVRELDNVIQRALILTQGLQIDASAIIIEGELESLVTPAFSASPVPAPLEDPSAQSVSAEFDSGLLGNEMKQQESQIILQTLSQCNGSRKAVAERLGISPRTLRYKLARMREMGVQVPA